MPPSRVVRLEPRSGAFTEPLVVVPFIVGPPLSLMKKTSVRPSCPLSLRAWRTRPMLSSMADIIAA